jgi:multisubunit Na+/H+ antiporter MnhC subunit
MLLALAIAEAGGNLLLVLAGFRGEAAAPILTGAEAARMVDPVPQALVLTAIVIGVGIQALAVGVLMRVYRAYGTLDLRELRLRMEVEIAAAAGIEAPGSQHAPAGERPLPPAVTPAKEAKA